MEVLQWPFFLVLASLVLSIFTFCRLRSTKSASRLPPGPRKLPLIGNLHNLAGSLPHRRLEALSLKFGPLMHLQLGELSVFVVSSPEFAEQVLKTHDASLASRPKVMSPEIIGYGFTTVSFSPYGEYWRQMKKFLSQELLSPKRVQSFRSIREQVFLDVVKTFASNEGFPVNFSEMVYSAVYEVVLMVLFGDVTKDSLNLVDIIKEAVVLSSGFNITDMYPSMELLRTFSTSRRKLFRYRRDADKVFDKMIQEHRAAIHNEGKNQDILDTLLKYQDEGSGFPLTTDNIKALIMDILTAGSDTSSVTSNWAMAEMMKNPTILKKAQQEVRDAFDDKGYVDESDLDQLKYLKAVIKETLRLYPPAPLLLPRKCIKTCEINGYEIPVDSTVMVNAWAINRDPSYWNNPDSFQPERFLDSTVDYKGNNFEYIPFGSGRRLCPGILFGLVNVHLPMAMFLYYFDWKLPAGMKPEEVDMTEGDGLTIPKKKPLLIVPLVKRALPATRFGDHPTCDGHKKNTTDTREMTWSNDDDDDQQQQTALQIVTSTKQNTCLSNPEDDQMGNIICPSCGHALKLRDQSGGVQDLPGLPAGVKFDPSDQEILKHLEAKVFADARKIHPLIDEFITTIEGENGICYTHPEKLPGVSTDGQIRHFFHRPSRAYTTGTRKRRKVHADADGSETRWHKTGNTRPVSSGGNVKGYKKILVLYTNYGRQRKPEKTNWVMHQYHLGHSEEEKDGELVVSKVFYQTQPRQCGGSSAVKEAIAAAGKSRYSGRSSGESPRFVEYYNNAALISYNGES